MPKLKTHKMSAKRFKISRPKKSKARAAKITHRAGGQDHFNARESGVVTKRKRRDKNLSKTHLKTIKILIGK